MYQSPEECMYFYIQCLSSGEHVAGDSTDGRD